MVKDSITKWFTNYPDQSIVNLPQRLSFGKIVINYPVYYIVLTTLFEEKICSEEEKPYEDEDLPYVPKITINNVNVSLLDCLLDDEFEEQSSSVILTDSMKKVNCMDCKGHGFVVCDLCDGRRYIRCDRCDEEGKIEVECEECHGGFIPCTTCDGRGEIELSASNYTTCPICKGSGHIQCRVCNGTGKVTQPCEKCDGTKFVPCWNCGGEGTIACIRCNGAKELLKYIEYKDKHKVNELTNSVFVNKFDKSCVENIVKEKYYQLIVSRDSSKLIDDIVLNLLPDFVKNPIKNLIVQVQNKVISTNTYSRQVIRQKLDIYRSDVYLANVKFDNKDYQFWIYGKQHNVQPVEHDPINDLYELYKNKIIELFEKKEYQELYSLLEKSIADFKPKHKEICNFFIELLKTIISLSKYEEAQKLIQKFIGLFKPYEEEFYKLFSEEIKNLAEKRNFQKANQAYNVVSSLFPQKSEELKTLSYIIDYNITLDELEKSIEQSDVKTAVEKIKKIVQSPVFDRKNFFPFYYKSLNKLFNQKKIYEAYKLLIDFNKIVKKQLKVKNLPENFVELKKQLFRNLVNPFYIGIVCGIIATIYFSVNQYNYTGIVSGASINIFLKTAFSYIVLFLFSLLIILLFVKQIVYYIKSFIFKFLIGSLLIIIIFLSILYSNIAKSFYYNVTKFVFRLLYTNYYSNTNYVMTFKPEGNYFDFHSYRLPFRQNTFCFSPDNKFFLTVDSVIKLWDMKTWKSKEIGEKIGETGRVVLSPTGRFIAVVEKYKIYDAYSNVSVIKIWNVDKGKLIKTIICEFEKESFIDTLDFSFDEKFLMAIDCNANVVYIFEVSSGRLIKAFTYTSEAKFTADGKYLVTFSISISIPMDVVKLWDISSWECVKEMPFDTSEFSSCFSSDGKFIIHWNGENIIELIDIQSWEVVKSIFIPKNLGMKLEKLVGEKYIIELITLSPDQKFIAINLGNKIKILDVDTGKILTTLKHKSVGLMRFSADSKFFASGGKKEIKIWDISNLDKIDILVEKALEEKYGKVKN
jgi:WD40 repeat protein/tetratricopeptide (TPR) repeat protein